jgi:hypothetical protein
VARLVNYMCLGATLTMSPVATTNIYGLRMGPQVYVMVLFGQIAASVLNVLSLEIAFPYLSNGADAGFRDLYFFGAFLTLLSLVILYFFREELDTERMRLKDML